jgi:FAD/FMN-containing dehydrogenase
MNLRNSLEAILGQKGWFTGPDTIRWERDWLGNDGEKPLGVACPSSSIEVSQVVSLCREANVPLVPQGGNTGLVGGSVLREPGGVILSMSRMNGIGCPDIASGTVDVEAGAILGALHQSLAGTGFMFPMHLGSEGSAQTGGLVSTNAGGSQSFRYGMMQDLVLGLEAVLPDGSIWNGMRRVQKDNSGYQFRKLLCGAEGTLGVVTRAVLKLAPEPSQQITALLAVPSIDAACEIATSCRMQAGEFLNALEFFSDFGLGMALEKIPSLHFPLSRRSTFYLLIEAGAGSPLVPLYEILSSIIEQAIISGLADDGTVAASLSQRRAIWRLREEQPEGQRLAGPQLKHDISVPPGLIADFLRRAQDTCETLAPGVRPNPFGHMGDGNVHYNLSPPAGALGFGEKAQLLSLALSELALNMRGSFAAEHGLGPAKRQLADMLQSPAERKLMMSIKHAVDNVGFLNRGSFV